MGRIILTSRTVKALEDVSADLIRNAKFRLLHVRGPIRFPNKVLRITTRKSPCGNGTVTFDKFEMRIHKRLVEIHSSSSDVGIIISTSKKQGVDVEIISDTRYP